VSRSTLTLMVYQVSSCMVSTMVKAVHASSLSLSVSCAVPLVAPPSFSTAM